MGTGNSTSTLKRADDPTPMSLADVPAHFEASHVRTASSTPLSRAALAEQIIGFRIMRRTEVAPGWWGQPTEVGETGSATVADSFCREQNAVTMDLNRGRRIEFYADPIYAPTAPLPSAAAEALARLERTSIAPAVVGAVTQYESAALQAVELSDLALVGLLSDLDADSLVHAEDLMADARTVLASAGLLHLVGGA